MKLLSSWIVVVFIHLDFSFCRAAQFNTSESTSSVHSSSGLYGYEISIQKLGNETSMVVGTPPTSPETGQGNLDKCIVLPSNTSSTTMRLECSSIPRPSGSLKSNLGQSFSTNPKTGEVLACSTTSAQVCTNTVTLPGYCYVYGSASTESQWKVLDHSTTRGCPVSSTVDVLFVLDGSGSVLDENFDKIKNWARAVTNELKVDEGVAKVAVIQFGSRVEIEINFNDYSDLSSLQAAILRISFHNGGSTRTVNALNEARNVLTGSERFAKEKNAQVMIILTDGRSSQSGVVDAANRIRSLGAITYAVGVGTGINNNELRQLATGTSSDDRVYEVDDFDKLGDIVDNLQKQIETFIPTEGNGNLTVELAQAGIGVAVTKNKTVTCMWWRCDRMGIGVCVEWMYVKRG